MASSVRLAIDRDNPPFTLQDDLTGEATGFSVELCRLCLEEAGTEAEFVAADGPFTQSIWLTSGRVDAVVDLTASERRQQWFDCSSGYYVDELAVFSHREGPLWAGLERVPGALAVKSNSYAEEWLRRHHPRLALRPVNEAAQLVATVAARRAAAFVVSRANGAALSAAHPEAGLRQAGPPFAPAALCLAVMHDRGDGLLRDFNRGLAELRAAGRFDELLRRWALAHA